MKDKTRDWLLKYGTHIIYTTAYTTITGICLLAGFVFIGWYYSG